LSGLLLAGQAGHGRETRAAILSFFAMTRASMDHDSSSLRIPVAMGELIDRLTILAIKEDKITDPIKLNHILAEKNDLAATLDPALANLPVDIQRSIEPLLVALLTINASLWEVE
jgi:hypothetical protein